MHDGASARGNGQSAGAADIGVVVAAHAPLAGALCESASRILGADACAQLRFIEVDASADAAATFAQLSEVIAAADQGRGVLLLADLFGGSAANIAIAYLGEHQLEVVTGASLPMILEALSHRGHEESPTSLARRVASAGQEAVVIAGALLARSPSTDRARQASA